MNGRAPAPDLAGFTFVRHLGSGGFADVYLYEQHLPRRRVAVKVMASDALTEETRSAFVAEANLMAQLAHPYIVKIFHADVAPDGRPFIIMEYCSGLNLATRYKTQPFSVVESLQTGVRIAGAVATAHASGVLHRDIKPHNVLANEYGWPILTDFGISSVVEEEALAVTTTRAPGGGSTTTTGSRSVGMSIPWSPPEMFDDDPKPDQRSDVFALAATIWTLLAGRSPYEVAGGPNGSIDLMSRIERGALTPFDRQDIPPSLVAVLRKGMAVDRGSRYASAIDFARALQAVEVELGYSPTQLDVISTTVAEPLRSAEPGAPDATRVRGVTSISAQPAPPSRTPILPPVPPAPSTVEDATMVRGAAAPAVAERTVVRSIASPTPMPTGAVAGGSTVPRRRIGLVVGLGAGVVAVVAGVLVVVPLIVGETVLAPPAEGPTAADSDDDTSPIVGTFVPTPELVSAEASADGASVVFTWDNPDPVDGDSYVWQRTDGAGAGDLTPSQEPTATIAGVAPGTTVCIEVFVRRAGELSPEPLEACVP